MPILQERDRQVVRQRLDADVKRDVTVTLFTRPESPLFIPGRECAGCGPTQELLEEISALCPRIHLDVVDFFTDRERVSDQGIGRIPATVVAGDRGTGVTFYGTPAGLEFAVLIESIIAASSRATPLQLETRRQLKHLKEDVRIQVFVTPSCQFCPVVASLAIAMAMESPRVTTDVVEIQDFPSLAQLYSVMGVPKTVINDSVQFTGAVTESAFLQRVLEAVGAAEPESGSRSRVSQQTTPIA